ncbi:MAG: response regulator [Chitinophagales bacterium]|nr:response regulator [Chitinophagaceae bacterium]MBP9883857.1 response regulator [Chitinophagales bacterium]
MAHTLLLVDDDITFSSIVKTSLEKEGYLVHAAHHAREAMQFLSEHAREIEVMLLDWSMPDISGIELLRAMKQHKHYEDIQVIMQTVLGNSENIQQGVEAGAFFYLVKPVKKDLLISTIRAAIVDFERKKGLLKKLAESERALRYLDEATFRFQTVAEGDQIAVFIANECPNPQEAIYISELFSNAVEHGNAALTYEEKTELISRNLLAKEIETRLSLPDNKDKYVEVKFKRNAECLCIQIADMGKGFNYNKYLQFDDTRIFDNHGRGIAILNALFPVHFMDQGNKVLVEIPLGGPAKQG